MVLPFSVITYYIIVARTFFNNSIPGDLWEAAQIDGCGNLGFFFQIVIPLSKAVLAVITESYYYSLPTAGNIPAASDIP